MPHRALQRDRETQQSVLECLECYAMCLDMVRHCLELGGAYAEPSHVAVLLTCARTCETSASTMLLGARQHGEVCRSCAVVCRECAESCRQVANGDEALLRCADICLRCARWCDRMAAATTEH